MHPQIVSPIHVANGSIGSGTSTSSLPDGTLHFSLKYDKFEGNLVIKILEISDLKVDDASSIISPYVRIRLYKSQRQMFSGAVDSFETEFKTRIQKFKDVLLFNETFRSAIAPTSVKHVSIKLQLCDLDKYSRKVVLGECRVKLKRLRLEDFEEKVLQEKLREPMEVRPFLPLLKYHIYLTY